MQTSVQVVEASQRRDEDYEILGTTGQDAETNTPIEVRGKAMAGLIDLIRKRRLTKRDTVVFIHTGGVAEVVAYGEEIKL